MLRSIFVAASLAFGLAGAALAQDKSKDDLPPPPAATITAPAPQGGIQGQNIFDVKPEVSPTPRPTPSI